MRKWIIAVLALLIASPALQAEEGMWMLNDLPMQELQAAGFQLSPGDIYDPAAPSISDAIVQIGGGTGSFVSSRGLVITNHHVAYSALQRISSSGQNYVNTGFQVSDRSDEVYVPGFKAYLAVEFTDVTRQILRGVNRRMAPADREKTIQRNINALEEKYASSNPDRFRFDVNKFYSGQKYYLFKYLKFEDIRLVYAPPLTIGKYGGDVDNWMWPRHTGDFAFFRVYASPDGQTTTHSEQNVPYQPKRFLKFSNDGLSTGDFTFIIGYPGRTQRYRSSYSVAHAIRQSYPYEIRMYTDAINLINRETADNEDLRIRYANTLASLNNYHKNYQGMLEGLQKADLVSQKQQQEAQFRQWMDQQRSRDRTYGDVLPGLQQTYTRVDSSFDQEMDLSSMNWLVKTYNAASVIDKWSVEKTKPNVDRDNQYTDANFPSLKERIQLMQNQFDPAVDAEMMKYFLTQLAALPANLQVTPLINALDRYRNIPRQKAINRFVDSLYSHTALTDPDRRTAMFDMSRKQLQGLHDSMLDFAMSLRPLKDRLEASDKGIDGRFSELRSTYIQGLQDWQDGNIYPDANFTPRLTYGTVKGYSPRDAVWYEPLTSGKGVLEKYTGKWPFDMPEKLLRLLQDRSYPDRFNDSNLHDVPVNFLHTTDITGGNSGSPVMDGRGRFIGIAFDGNWESIVADWVFIPEITRSISVDARYILFILREYADNEYVLNELEIE